MFVQRPEARAPGTAQVEVFVDGRSLRVPEGASAAAAVLLAGIPPSAARR